MDNDYWTVNERLQFILGAFWEHDAEVPDEALLQLESRLSARLREDNLALLEAYEYLLLLLASRKTRGTRQIILRASEAFPELAEPAARALAILDKLPDPFVFVRNRFRQVGLAGLTENQKLFYCVDELHSSDFFSYFCEIGDVDDDHVIGDAILRQKYVRAGLQSLRAKEAARFVELLFNGGDPQQAEAGFRNAEDIPALLIHFARKHRRDFAE